MSSTNILISDKKTATRYAADFYHTKSGNTVKESQFPVYKFGTSFIHQRLDLLLIVIMVLGVNVRTLLL